MTQNAITWKDGFWHEGNPPMFGPMTHSLWMASAVFDGARSFERLSPDLDRHCRRVLESARVFGMTPDISAEEIERLAWEGIEKFPPETALYIRPLFYFEEGFVTPKAESGRFILSVFDSPMPEFHGLTACISRFRRPSPEMAPTGAKAACLYPNVSRTLLDARDRGFDNAVVLDGLGNLAEFGTANLFMVKDGVVMTPVPNGTFLAGITRSRVMELLRGDGIEVRECTLTPDDLFAADEVFQTGNYSKVLPVIRVEDREYPEGPVTKRARELYMAFAEREGGKRIE